MPASSRGSALGIAELLELIEARGALSDMRKDWAKLRISDVRSEFQERIVTRTSDSLWIREDLVHHCFESFNQTFFPIH